MKMHDAMFRVPNGPESDDEFIQSATDISGPIDFDAIKLETSEHGPLILSRTDCDIQLHFSISPCRCGIYSCTDDVISVHYLAGATSLVTLVDKSALMANDSLAGFFDDFVHNPFVYFGTSAEMQLVEAEIEKHLGFSPMDVYTGKTDFSAIQAHLSGECEQDIWRAHALQSIFRTLYLQRLEIQHFDDEFVEKINDRFSTGEEFKNFLRSLVNYGFLSARLITEHFVRYELEPVIQKGVAADNAQRKRNDASGKSASNKRYRRVEAMLSSLEALIEANPAMRRMPLEQVAELAIGDAIASDPKLWTQGKGRRDEYLEEMRVDIRFKDRFRALR